MKPDYTYWRTALAGEKPKMFVDDPQLGFYRKPIRERDAKGNNKTVGYDPVAIFIPGGGEMIAQIGHERLVVDRDKINELWSWVAGNPITEETWRAVAERDEPWPDFQPMETVPAANREVPKSDNAPPDEPLDVQHATAVDNAIAAAIKTVTNEADAAKALGSKNRIAELRLAADKAGKAIYEPIYRQYTAEQKKWSPIVARAQAEEKRLNTEILTFREKERQRIAKEAAEAEAKRIAEEERNARAADRAIAAGEPEPPPVTTPAPEPAAAAPIVPTYGTRKLKEDLKKFIVIDDLHAVFVQFKGHQEVVDLLTKLAQAELNAGRQPAGTHYREGLI